MELKSYQVETVKDVEDYCDRLIETGSANVAYDELWKMKRSDGRVFGEIRGYKTNEIKSPRICIKIPTAGGKTITAASTIKPVLERLKGMDVVVWLVPTDAILEQTYRNLNDPDHPYRQILNRDFNGRVGIYDIEALLMGQDFQPAILEDQLSVFILSYDSLKAKDKSSRRLGRTNGMMHDVIALMRGKEYTTETAIEGAEPCSPYMGLKVLNPYVIIDESHKTRSKLSKDMINNLSPRLVLEMTATPLDTSNIISAVTADRLKKENMVKLPVFMWGRSSVQEVITTAIDMRDTLEMIAYQAEKNAGPGKGMYIRPIVLFQAQPRTDNDNETFDRIRKKLIEDYGIPEDEIAVKTSKINELKNVDLLSRDCNIRFIITVNALNEGWDCPFAYILATLANKTSDTDVQQIVGRILRQPYATRSTEPNLNASYILTTSVDFHRTAANIIESLKDEGFSAMNVRVKDDNRDSLDYWMSGENKDDGNTGTATPEMPKGPENKIESTPTDPEEWGTPEHIETPEERRERIKKQLEHAADEEEVVKKEIDSGEYKVETTDEGGIEDYMSRTSKVKEQFKSELKDIKVPIPCIRVHNPFGGEPGCEEITREALSKGFSLSKCGLPEFNFSDYDLARADVSSSGDSLTYVGISTSDAKSFTNSFNIRSYSHSEQRIRRDIVNGLRFDNILQSDLEKYVKRIFEDEDSTTIDQIKKDQARATRMIGEAIRGHLDEYVNRRTKDLYRENKVVLDRSRMYSLPDRITIDEKVGIEYSKSLYTYENRMTGPELDCVRILENDENVRWWHKIIERRNNEFSLCIGSKQHYPDFIVSTRKGNILFIETKGDQLDGSDTRWKTEMGNLWATMCRGKRDFPSIHYYMVFKTGNEYIDHSVSMDKLRDILETIDSETHELSIDQ